MGNKRITKIVGYINEDIIEKYNLDEYTGKPIVQSLDLYAHIQKHLKDFKSVDSFNYAVSNINIVIKEPDFVYNEKDRNSYCIIKNYKKMFALLLN